METAPALMPPGMPQRQPTSRRARRARVRLACRDGDKPALDRGKQRRRQRPVIAALRLQRPDVGPRPGEPVAFRQNDPRPLAVKPQAQLAAAGISMASAGTDGGVWVIGRTRTTGEPSSCMATSASTRQGRSLSPFFRAPRGSHRSQGQKKRKTWPTLMSAGSIFCRQAFCSGEF